MLISLIVPPDRAQGARTSGNPGDVGPFTGFVLNAKVRIEDIAGFYGLKPGPLPGDLTLGEYAARALHGCPLPRDSVVLGGARLTVLSTAGLRVERLELNFETQAITPAAKQSRRRKAMPRPCAEAMQALAMPA